MLIRRHLGPQYQDGHDFTSNTKGQYTAYTFWVILENELEELELRKAIERLPGYVMQL